MSWSPPPELERLVSIAANDRRENYHHAVGRESKALDAQLAARGTLLSGGRIHGQQELRARHFEECALGTIDDVLNLVRELHSGEIPVEAAPWVREILLRWINPLAGGIADQIAELAKQANINVPKERFYPRAEMGKVERRIELELGKALYKAQLRRLTPPDPSAKAAASGVDLFVSHASEDKEEVARPLAERLRGAGFAVWLDEAELTLGDQLLDRIDEGIANCRFGVVVLSPHFFAKRWPRRELAGLAAREDAEDRKVILPVWHRVTHDEIAKHSPLLAGVLGVSTDKGLDAVTAEIVRVLKS